MPKSCAYSLPQRHTRTVSDDVWECHVHGNHKRHVPVGEACPQCKGTPSSEHPMMKCPDLAAWTVSLHGAPGDPITQVDLCVGCATTALNRAPSEDLGDVPYIGT